MFSLLQNLVCIVKVYNVTDREIENIIWSPTFVDPEDHILGVIAGANENDNVRVMFFKGDASTLCIGAYCPMTKDKDDIIQAQERLTALCKKLKREGKSVEAENNIPKHIVGTDFEPLVKLLHVHL